LLTNARTVLTIRDQGSGIRDQQTGIRNEERGITTPDTRYLIHDT
jgi:hypothetical protein